jgi:hypothetical protein
MNKIIVKAEVSEFRTTRVFDLDETGYTKEEWDELPADKKQTILQELLEGLAEQPYFCVVNWEEK